VPQDRYQLLDELVEPFDACSRRIFPLGRRARFDLFEYLSSVPLEKFD
jgi:hypothetical protein